MDEGQQVRDLTWTVSEVGKGDGDSLLEAGEKFEVTVTLTALSPALGASDTFTLEVTPSQGTVLTVEKTIPSVVDDVMDLK